LSYGGKYLQSSPDVFQQVVADYVDDSRKDHQSAAYHGGSCYQNPSPEPANTLLTCGVAVSQTAAHGRRPRLLQREGRRAAPR
jgi:hypothetical protein